MPRLQIPIRWVTKRIEKAQYGELDTILAALLKCHSKLYPKQEMVILILPKEDGKMRNKEIDRIASYLKLEMPK